MKLPKKTRRYCPYCKKHTEQKISQAKSGAQRGAFKRGSPTRARKRGLARGVGSHGKWPPSKPAITKWKRKTKSTKKTNLVYTCKVCNKSTLQRRGIRTGRVMFKEEGK
ncbi:MAG: 50S ribosomal protein L44e [Candidatus Pacearchaeota archaeon]|nr:50S ribosomal protein L44e [Candidatus Pacearchaeota archaeon]